MTYVESFLEKKANDTLRELLLIAAMNTLYAGAGAGIGAGVGGLKSLYDKHTNKNNKNFDHEKNLNRLLKKNLVRGGVSGVIAGNALGLAARKAFHGSFF
jgi:hypothetical protein